MAVSALIGNWSTSTIGASGAIYGLLLAFGVMYPNQIVLFSFLFPIKAKYFVMIYGAIALLSSLNVNSGVSDVAHLGGMLFGLAVPQAAPAQLSSLGDWRGRYREWKLQARQDEVPGLHAQTQRRPRPLGELSPATPGVAANRLFWYSEVTVYEKSA